MHIELNAKIRVTKQTTSNQSTRQQKADRIEKIIDQEPRTKNKPVIKKE